MIRKSMPSGREPMGGTGFAKKDHAQTSSDIPAIGFKTNIPIGTTLP
jgi:hypothetical protein